MSWYKIMRTKDCKKIKLFGVPIYVKNVFDNFIERRYLGGLYVTKSNNAWKKYYLLFIRIKKKKYNQTDVVPQYNYTNAFIMEYFCKQQYEKYFQHPLDICHLLTAAKSIIISGSTSYLNHAHGWLHYLFKGEVNSIDSLPYDNKSADLFVLLGGIGQTIAQIQVVVEAMQINKPVLILEAAFLRSINTFCEQQYEPQYRYDVGFVLDYLTAYYDATRPSLLENMLNDSKLIITQEQRKRAHDCINKIVRNYLTKYNCQPIFSPNIGRKGAKKVLVVDQSFGDNSVKKGLASVSTFEKMLQAAIDENPNADIIVKTHPDTKTGLRTGYYSQLVPKGNIYLYTEPINPIALINYVDEVYVCTTQMGFESLMCGKKPHVFGMPFYAGWGVTDDRQTCSRRKNKRTVEEIFYIAYILYSYYVSPEKKGLCEIEEAIEFLLKERKEYFTQKGVKCEITV